MIGATMSTERRLRNATAFDLHAAEVTTHVTLEECLAHLRNDSRRPDHHSAHRDQLVDVLRVQVSHAGHLFHAEWTNLHENYTFQLHFAVKRLWPSVQYPGFVQKSDCGFPGQNYFFFPHFSRHFVNKTLQNWLLNAEICYTMYSSILTTELASNF